MDNLGDLIKLFQTQGVVARHTKGTVIINQGDELANILFIGSGLVKITDSEKQGYGRTTAIFGKHHFIPVSWLLIEPLKAGALYNYIALADTITYSLPRQLVHDILDANPHIYKSLVDIMSRAYINASFRIYNLQKTNVSEKVEFILYYLATLYSAKKNDPIAEIEASLTHQDIADIAGLSRESVTHLLSKPRYRNIFWKKDGKSYINVTKLDTSSLPQILIMPF